MSVQQQTDINAHPYILEGTPITARATVSQDAGRSADMVKGTVMAYNPTTAEYEPWTDETAVDGTAHPCAILLDLLATADIVAGDIDDVSLIVGGVGLILNEDLLTFENSLTKDTIVNVPTNLNKSATQLLRECNIHFSDVVDGSAFEAA